MYFVFWEATKNICKLPYTGAQNEWVVFCFLQTHDNKEHLAMMERILGTLPYRMIKKTK